MNTIYKIKDSVDLFLTDGEFLTAYYMNTRQRKTFRISEAMVSLIEHIDGVNTLGDIICHMTANADVSKESVLNVIEALEKNRIIAERTPFNGIIPEKDVLRYDRQINYFQEFFQSDTEGVSAQKKLGSTKVLLFGCGAIGSDIAIILAMAGVRNFILYDSDIVETSDIARHMFFCKESVGEKKASVLTDYIMSIDSLIDVNIIDEHLNPYADIQAIVSDADFVINTLDEPYIGYTASKISRVCVKQNKAHYIAGGFDAHLASTGELIIPRVTPCVECYAQYFKKSLKDWKPKSHPVKERSNEIGGLSSMSLFSASFAAIEIIKYIVGISDIKKDYKIRGEFLFGDMDLTYLNITKDPKCLICGG